MYYRELGFLAVVWYGFFPLSPPSPVRKLSLFLSLRVCPRSNLLTGGGKGVVVKGAKSYDGEKSLVLYNPLTTLWSTN